MKYLLYQKSNEWIVDHYLEKILKCVDGQNLKKILEKYNTIKKNPFLDSKTLTVLHFYFYKNLAIRYQFKKIFHLYRLYKINSTSPPLETFQDLHLENFNSLEKKITLIQNNHKWHFKCSQLKKLISMALQNREGLVPTPYKLKNPYNNMKFKYLHWVSIYQQFHDYGEKLSKLMLLFKISNFSLRKLLCNFNAYMNLHACLLSIKEMDDKIFQRECISTLEDLKYKPCVTCINKSVREDLNLRDIFHTMVYHYHLCTFSNYPLEADGFNKKKFLRKLHTHIKKIKKEYPDFFISTHPLRHRKIFRISKYKKINHKSSETPFHFTLEHSNIQEFNFKSNSDENTDINLENSQSEEAIFIFGENHSVVL